MFIIHRTLRTTDMSVGRVPLNHIDNPGNQGYNSNIIQYHKYRHFKIFRCTCTCMPRSLGSLDQREKEYCIPVLHLLRNVHNVYGNTLMNACIPLNL